MLLSLPKGQPSSVFSRMRARVSRASTKHTSGAELLPALIICRSRPFSGVLSWTPYLS